MAITYFGNVDPETGDNEGDGAAILYGRTRGIDGTNIPFYECPGTGTQQVASLGAKITAGSGETIRLALYTTGGNLVAQGSGAITVNGAGWYEHTSFVDVSGNPITTVELTGGTRYQIILSGTGTGNLTARKTTVTSGWARYSTAVYVVDGFPSSIATPLANNSGDHIISRCGVEPEAAGGPTMPVLSRSMSGGMQELRGL